MVYDPAIEAVRKARREAAQRTASPVTNLTDARFAAQKVAPTPAMPPLPAPRPVVTVTTKTVSTLVTKPTQSQTMRIDTLGEAGRPLAVPGVSFQQNQGLPFRGVVGVPSPKTTPYQPPRNTSPYQDQQVDAQALQQGVFRGITAPPQQPITRLEPGMDDIGPSLTRAFLRGANNMIPDMSPAGIAHRREVADMLPSSADSRAVESEGQGDFFRTAGAYARHPLALAELLTQSATAQLPSMALLPLTGGLSGLPAFLARGGIVATTSGTLTAISQFDSELQNMGVDTSSEEAIAAALQDPKKRALASKAATAYGLVVGTVDGVTAGLAGRYTGAGKTLGQKVARGILESTINMGAAGGGDIAGQVSRDLAAGRNINIDFANTAGEIWGEIPGAAVETMTGAMANPPVRPRRPGPGTAPYAATVAKSAGLIPGTSASPVTPAVAPEVIVTPTKTPAAKKTYTLPAVGETVTYRDHQGMTKTGKVVKQNMDDGYVEVRVPGERIVDFAREDQIVTPAAPVAPTAPSPAAATPKKATPANDWSTEIIRAMRAEEAGTATPAQQALLDDWHAESQARDQQPAAPVPQTVPQTEGNAPPVAVTPPAPAAAPLKPSSWTKRLGLTEDDLAAVAPHLPREGRVTVTHEAGYSAGILAALRGEDAPAPDLGEVMQRHIDAGYAHGLTVRDQGVTLDTPPAAPAAPPVGETPPVGGMDAQRQTPTAAPTPAATRPTPIPDFTPDEQALVDQVAQRAGWEQTRNLHVNEDEFQFRRSTTPDITRWDPLQAGYIGVWRDAQGEIGPAGQLYVVDGHHRLGSARRLNVGAVQVEYAPEGMTARDARAWAAMRNISVSPHIDPLDVARFLRETNKSADDQAAMLRKAGINLSGRRKSVIEQAMAMAQLPAEIFDAIYTENDETMTRAAGVIAMEAKHPEDQRKLWAALQRQPDMRVSTLRAQAQALTKRRYPQNMSLMLDDVETSMIRARVVEGLERYYASRTREGRKGEGADAYGDSEEQQNLKIWYNRILEQVRDAANQTTPLGKLVSDAVARIQEGQDEDTAITELARHLRASNVIEETIEQGGVATRHSGRASVGLPVRNDGSAPQVADAQAAGEVAPAAPDAPPAPDAPLPPAKPAPKAKDFKRLTFERAVAQLGEAWVNDADAVEAFVELVTARAEAMGRTTSEFVGDFIAAIKADRYDISDANYQANKGAFYPLGDGRALILALNGPDVSTIVHELGHVFMQTLDANQRRVVATYFGVQENGTFSADQQERFARLFERYLRDGQAPNPRLRDIFARFKEWLTNIYQAIKGSPIEEAVSPEMKRLFDDMLSRPEERAQRAARAEMEASGQTLFQRRQSRLQQDTERRAAARWGTRPETLPESAITTGAAMQARREGRTVISDIANDLRTLWTSERVPPAVRLRLRDLLDLANQTPSNDQQSVVTLDTALRDAITQPGLPEHVRAGLIFARDRLDQPDPQGPLREEVTNNTPYPPIPDVLREGERRAETRWGPRPDAVRPGDTPVAAVPSARDTTKTGPGRNVTTPAQGALFQARDPQTETPAFKRWFGDSKIVDAQGKPLRVYHGSASPEGFTVFTPHAPTDVYTVDGEEVKRADSWDMGADRQGMPDAYHYGALSDALALGPEKGLQHRQRDVDYLTQKYADEGKAYTPSPDTTRHLNDLKRLAGKSVKIRTESRPTGDGVWFAPSEQYSFIANAHVREHGAVYPVYLSIKNPAFVNASEIEQAGRSWRVDEYKKQGYDGVIYATDQRDLTKWGWAGASQIVAFDPEQIKSAIGNRGTFDAKNPNILFQGRDNTDQPRLSVLHNLTADNLLFADQQGGLAVPSLAVVRDGMGMDGFGEITLIGERDLADPEQEMVFDADAYTARFPRAEYKKASSAKVQTLIDRLKPFFTKYDDQSTQYQVWDDLVNYARPERAAEYLLHSATGEAAFLASQGVTVEPVMRQAQMSGIVSDDPAVQRWFKTFDWDAYSRRAHDDPANVALRKKAGAVIDAAIERVVGKAEKRGREHYDDFAASLRYKNLDDDGSITESALSALHQDAARFGTQEVDRGATRDALHAALKGKEAEYKAWVDAQILPLAGDPMITVGRKKVPYTLANITEAMRAGRNARNQEAGMTFGEGAARASASYRFRDLPEMRRAAATDIQPDDVVHAARDEARALLEQYRGAITDYYGVKGADRNEFGRTWDALDASMRAMARWAKGAHTPGNMSSALRAEGFRAVPAEVLQLAMRAGEAFLKAPVPYFEAKPQRAVRLNEFAGAVIPASAGAEVRARLDKHGIPYREYATPEDRTQTIDAFRAELDRQGKQVLFQSQAQPADPFFSAVARAVDAKMPAKAQTNAVRALLLNTAGVKAEEMTWTGLDDFLATPRPVTKQEVQDFLRQHAVGVQEVMKGEKQPYTQEEVTWNERTWKAGTPDEEMSYYSPELNVNIWPDGEGGFTYYDNKYSDDLKFSSLDEAKDGVLQYVNDNHAGVPTKFDQYQLPGGENYRELLFTLPQKMPSFEDFAAARPHLSENALNAAWNDVQNGRSTPNETSTYNGSHWAEPNVLAHVRFNERQDAEGRRVLFIEEVQSDWHQKGRKLREGEIRRIMDTQGIPRAEAVKRVPDDYGYDTKRPTPQEAKNFFGISDADWDMITPETQQSYVQDMTESYYYKNYKVPDAPFKKTWHELALKRMLRWAAEHGFDRIAWTTGDQQAERYDISKHLDMLNWRRLDNGDYNIWGFKDHDRVLVKENIPPRELPDVIGKELSDQIAAREDNAGVLKGLDLKVGGEGMKGFYDKIMPDFLTKYGKKWGATVGQTTIGHNVPTEDAFDDQGNRVMPKGGVPVHTLPITDAMRDSVMQGQPLFQERESSEERQIEKHALTPGFAEQVEAARHPNETKAKLREAYTTVKEHATRAYPHLDPVRYAEAYRVLRVFHNRKQNSIRRAMDMVKTIVADLNPEQFDVFEKAVLINDLVATMDAQLAVIRKQGYGKVTLPFDLTPQLLNENAANVKVWVDEDPIVKAALARRKQLWEDLKSLYISRMSDVALDIKDRLTREDYFRHIMITEEAFRRAKGATRLQPDLQRGYLKRRTASEEAYRTDYLATEMQVLTQMYEDIAVSDALTGIEDWYDERTKYMEKAAAINKRKGEGEAVSWQTLARRDGHTVWAVREGSFHFSSYSVPSTILSEAQRQGLETLTLNVDDLQKVVALGGKYKEYALPPELAATLDDVVPQHTEHWIGAAAKTVMRGWKTAVLMSPTRVVTYNLRNISGDLEAVLRGNPTAVRMIPRAVKELTAFYRTNVRTATLDYFLEEGGADGSMQVDELGDPSQILLFAHLFETKALSWKTPLRILAKYWGVARMATSFREAILRYAVYLEYLDNDLRPKEERGVNHYDLKPKNYGASVRQRVDALHGAEAKAMQLTMDLLGDYGELSANGQYIRDHIIPFYSWMEINAKREQGMARNMRQDTQMRALEFKANPTLKNAGKVAVPPVLWAGGILAALTWTTAWNYKFFRKEEEELPDDVRKLPHLILGVVNGVAQYFPRLGSLPDFLNNFGLDKAPAEIRDVLNGRQSLTQAAQALGWNLVEGATNKVVQGINPGVKLFAEITTKRSLYPNVFHPTPINDMPQYLADQTTFGKEFAAARGRPQDRPYWQQWTPQSRMAYDSDPLEAAYYNLANRKDKFLELQGVPRQITTDKTPKGQALWFLKRAMRYDHAKAVQRYVNLYVQRGGTVAGAETSVRDMDPLHSIPNDLEDAFVQWLGPQDATTLKNAQAYYERLQSRLPAVVEAIRAAGGAEAPARAGTRGPARPTRPRRPAGVGSSFEELKGL